jgi:phosphoribosylanthranilate isomerase
MTRVKICGITTLEDAAVAVEAGADALGFIFVEHTPRFVTPAQVAPIVRALPPSVTAVGVFWDHAAAHVRAVVAACGLGALQFHGDEKPEDLDGYAVPVIKAIKVGAAGDLARAEPYRGHADALLLDSAARWSEGEPRSPIAWEVAARVRGCVILSAGLTPDNVARAVAVARPYAVDVNSGVESALGRKDADKVRRFVTAAKGAA